MGSVATKSGHRVEQASLSAAEGYGRGLRALALAPRWIGRAWRTLVESVGQQTCYLVGPSPWMLRDMGRDAAREDGDGPSTGDGPAGPGSPGRPSPVEVIRLKAARPRTLAGVR